MYASLFNATLFVGGMAVLFKMVVSVILAVTPSETRFQRRLRHFG